MIIAPWENLLMNPASARATDTVQTRKLTLGDRPQVAKLHAHVFGPGRFARSAYRIREAAPPLSPYCSGAFAGDHLIASVQLTPILIGGNGPHLLLGPLAVDPAFAGHGHGKSLVAQAIDEARANAIGCIVLIGDVPYYGRFGFKPVRPGSITLPGPVNPARILAVELIPGALATAVGAITAAR
jgi:predicted N-acetyltransferase YhbS